MRNISYHQAEMERPFASGLVILSLGSLFVGGMTAVRLLYEALYPQALWLREPLTAVLLAAIVVVVGIGLGSRFFKAQAAAALTPLLLNLFYLLHPAADLTTGRFLFLASLWLVALFLSNNQGALDRWRPLSPLFVVAFLLPVYLLTLGRTVGTADTFEFQVVIPRLGIVHPTGYPLYLLLTRPFTFIPLNSVAWRVNVGTAVYGIGAACLLYQFLKSLTGQRVVPILTAVLFGLSPTFWSQSIQAEVYALHALIVSAVLVVVQRIGKWQLEQPAENQASSPGKKPFLLAALLGLGLTNHLTTLILLPPVVLNYLIEAIRGRKQMSNSAANWGAIIRKNIKPLALMLAAFLAPLLLYLYLPLRWQAVNGEPMGLNRFVDWVVGGRFQGALQLTAVLHDPARLGVVGRLYTAEWHWVHLLVALIGLIVLARRVWPAALFLALTWLGFTYYALSYYVPDLSVFLIPAHLMIAALWGVGLASAVRFLIANRLAGSFLLYPLLSMVMFVVLQQAVNTWNQVDASQNDGQTTWGRAVLAQPLDPQGAILADSLKFPPLYYLQQAEGLRPQMDIVVSPDEAAYRAELDGRLAAGQTVYLARFLPGLAGSYYLRSVGPLTEVSTQPVTTLPETADLTTSNLAFDRIKLAGYTLQMESPFAAGESAVTFYWQTAEPVEPVWLVYVRWIGEGYSGPITSQHPANNNYPTNAWRPGEIVADFHALPRPTLNQPTELALQVALAPAFTPPAELAWQTVTTAVWQPQSVLQDGTALRVQIGPLLVNGASFPQQIRPSADLQVQLHGFGTGPDGLSLALYPAEGYTPVASDLETADTDSDTAFTWAYELAADVAPGAYLLAASYPDQPSRCSWLAKKTAECVLGEVVVSGAPLPEGAANFEDKVALLAIDVPDPTLQPGGQLAVNLVWQGLGNMDEDYTVFVQVLDEHDQIVGQADSWPLQGTFPTSAWAVGERVEDPYLVRLSEELPPGQYRLQVGWYLLGTTRRLPVLDESGTAVDDKVVVTLGMYP
ncbi:MAG: DUF2723 domain-containing protein [Candidatus Promineifilaceae bacterium]